MIDKPSRGLDKQLFALRIALPLHCKRENNIRNKIRNKSSQQLKTSKAMKKIVSILAICLGCFGIIEAQTIQKPECVTKRYTYGDIFNNDTITEEMTLRGTFHYNAQGLVSCYECYIVYGSYGNEYYDKHYWYDYAHRLTKYSYGGYSGGGLYGVDSVYYVYNNDLLYYTKKLYVNKWGGWYYTDSVAYHYYDDGTLSRKEQYGRNPDDLHWPSVPYLVTEFVYEETELEKTKIETRFRNESIDDRKTTHYDLNDNILDFLYENYNGYDYLREGYTTTYGYDNGLCQTKTRQKWSVENNCWVNDSSFVFQYNDMGIRTEAVAQIWVDNQWQNVQRTRWGVEEDGTMLSITYEIWTDSLFVNTKRVEYHYDENGLCIKIDGLVWSDEGWIFGMAGVNGVGGRNERIFWNESLSAEDKLIRATSHSFSNITITWQTVYDGVEEKEETTNENGFAVYPNPAKGILNVSVRLPQCDSPTATKNAYRITNLMGQTLLQGTLTAENQQIDITDLPSGMYFISVDGQTVKFVVR
jgi:hypothetical protein